MDHQYETISIYFIPHDCAVGVSVGFLQPYQTHKGQKSDLIVNCRILIENVFVCHIVFVKKEKKL